MFPAASLNPGGLVCSFPASLAYLDPSLQLGSWDWGHLDVLWSGQRLEVRIGQGSLCP